jgi:hypothetical protein
MQKVKVLVFAVIFCLLFAANLTAIPDPGEPDTVKLEGGPLIIGESVPISLTIVNDEPLGGFSLGFSFGQEFAGFARFDSVVYVGRMADPSVLSWRSVSDLYLNGEAPDTIMLGAGKFAYNELPVGNEPIIEIYFTGLSPGQMTIDSVFYPPAGDFVLSSAGGYNIWPQFQSLTTQVTQANAPPEIAISQSNSIIIAGESLELQIEADPPLDPPVEFQVVSFFGYDDNTVYPVNPAQISGSNTAQLTWNPTFGDVGIWVINIEGCNGSGICDTVSTIVQVLENADYNVTFSVEDLTLDSYTSGLIHGNFDMDPEDEVYISGMLNNTGEIFDVTMDGWESLYSIDEYDFAFGPRSGFFNNDNCLDIIQMVHVGSGANRVQVSTGDCGGTLTPVPRDNDGYGTRSCALGELTADNYLDYVAASPNGVRIYAGDDNQNFHLAQYLQPADASLTVNCADFNADGLDDLAVGTESGLVIYLNNGDGSFDPAYSYPQTYGSIEIEVANQGSDFNADNVFDLCISTPSVGGAESEMVIYLGNGDGSFSGNPVRTFKGQIFGNCIGDFNNDHMLDIAFVNGARRYVGILFGDDTGQFPNEIRYPINHPSLRFIDCFDADLDGDLDLVVSGSDAENGSNLYFLTNELNPSGFANKSLAISGLDNAELQLNSSSGDMINKFRSTMSDGAYYKRNLDANELIDDYVTLSSIESGEYSLKAQAKPNVEDGEKFCLEFSLDGVKYRLAKDADASEVGYNFGVYFDQSSVTPTPGTFLRDKHPQISWEGEGNFDLELASDINFENIIEAGLVDGNSYLPQTDLASLDTTAYYWRVKPHGESEYQKIYVFNVVTGFTDAEDEATDQSVPDKFDLAQNYPNPFNPSTHIKYSLPVDAHVTITVYNILGQKTKSLIDEKMPAGNHSISWDGTTADSRPAASGIYFYRIETGDYTKTMKMILQK